MSLREKSDQELNDIVDHTHAVFAEVAELLDREPKVTNAVRTLIQSESTMEDFAALFISEAEITEQILMASLSSLVNAHSLMTVRNEMQRRANDA